MLKSYILVSPWTIKNKITVFDGNAVKIYTGLKTIKGIRIIYFSMYYNTTYRQKTNRDFFLLLLFVRIYAYTLYMLLLILSLKLHQN